MDSNIDIKNIIPVDPSELPFGNIRIDKDELLACSPVYHHLEELNRRLQPPLPNIRSYPAEAVAEIKQLQETIARMEAKKPKFWERPIVTATLGSIVGALIAWILSNM